MPRTASRSVCARSQRQSFPPTRRSPAFAKRGLKGCSLVALLKCMIAGNAEEHRNGKGNRVRFALIQAMVSRLRERAFQEPFVAKLSRSPSSRRTKGSPAPSTISRLSSIISAGSSQSGSLGEFSQYLGVALRNRFVCGRDVHLTCPRAHGARCGC